MLTIGVKDVLLMLLRLEIVNVEPDIFALESLLVRVLFDSLVRLDAISRMFLWLVFLIIGMMSLFGVLAVKLML